MLSPQDALLAFKMFTIEKMDTHRITTIFCTAGTAVTEAHVYNWLAHIREQVKFNPGGYFGKAMREIAA